MTDKTNQILNYLKDYYLNDCPENYLDLAVENVVNLKTFYYITCQFEKFLAAQNKISPEQFNFILNHWIDFYTANSEIINKRNNG